MAGGPAADGGGIGANAPKVRSSRSPCSLEVANILSLEQMGGYSHDRYLPFAFAFFAFAKSLFFSAFSAFGGILFGYDTGVISGIKEMREWLQEFGHQVPVSTDAPFGWTITSSTESLVVSILSAGTFVGALLAAPTADILGRKWVRLFSLSICCLILTSSPSRVSSWLVLSSVSVSLCKPPPPPFLSS